MLTTVMDELDVAVSKPRTQTAREKTEGGHATDLLPHQHLAQDETGLDGLAEPDIIGDEQVHARHLKRATERL